MTLSCMTRDTDVRSRYRILNFVRSVERALEEVREAYCGLIERRAEGERFSRKSQWNKPVLVRSKGLVRGGGAGRLGQRRIELGPVEENNDTTWRAGDLAPLQVISWGSSGFQ